MFTKLNDSVNEYDSNDKIQCQKMKHQQHNIKIFVTQCKIK